MPSSSWICTNNTKTMLLRIVHPGGRVEVHDRPVTAAEIMCRNPRCCVAHPFVFQQPWAVVEPDTVLMLGQKFYVVPISTIRKLQGLSPRNSPSPAREMTIGSLLDETRNTQSRTVKEDDGMISTCCIFRKKHIAKKANNYKQRSKNESKKSETRSDVRNQSVDVNETNGSLSYDKIFVRLFNGGVTKANVSNATKETRTSSSSTDLRDSNTANRKRKTDLAGKRSSPKRAWSSDYWQPSLDSITEE
ncbi:hypothetical protein MtrunA17_Chr2g0333711 [Medicago truncatula]|uniref:DUF4228 domain protein n=1 Tax=Medicago truncatula TaxID=3880 RepID=A0A072VDE1_MEDTR|nr:DUF4228 domain protein [Medicago truncatula]RHN76584.1 hypothetical protein MtrunA17_Chr2g0333711 [Medicago truncatula]